MILLVSLVLIAALAVAGLAALRRWSAPRKVGDTPAAQEARTTEAKADAAAETQHTAAMQAADTRLEEHRKADAVDDVNAWLKKRRGGTALILLVFLLPGLARAECVRHGADVTCTYQDLVALRDTLAKLEHDRDVARADATRAGAELEAARVHVAALEAAPASAQGIPWGWVAGGAAVGALLVLGVVVAAR